MVCYCGRETNARFIIFSPHFGGTTWRRLFRSSSPLDSNPLPSRRHAHSTVQHTFLFASTHKRPRVKNHNNAHKACNVSIFAASCRSRNSRFAPRRVRTRSLLCLLLTVIFSPCHDHCLFIYSSFRFFNCYIDPPVVLCGPQLASMLGCWAATKDVKSIGPCREHAEALFECMRTAVRSLSASFVSRHGN